MKQIENRCIGCSTPLYPCRGASCPNRRYKAHYCDRCGEEIVNPFVTDDGKEICEYCRDALYGFDEEVAEEFEED